MRAQSYCANLNHSISDMVLLYLHCRVFWVPVLPWRFKNNTDRSTLRREGTLLPASYRSDNQSHYICPHIWGYYTILYNIIWFIVSFLWQRFLCLMSCLWVEYCLLMVSCIFYKTVICVWMHHNGIPNRQLWFTSQQRDIICLDMLFFNMDRFGFETSN